MSADTVLFDATLRPNPPLGLAALKGVVVAVALINLAFGGYFVWRGAWPVTPFMGADVLLLAWAFRATHRAARLWEHLKLTPHALRVERHPPQGAPSRVELNPYWVRIDVEEPPGSRSRLTLRSHGRAVEVGAFLAPSARLSLASGLRTALQSAREVRIE